MTAISSGKTYINDKSMAVNIRRLRRAKGLSQDALAAKLQTVGLDIARGRLSLIELNQRPVPAALIPALVVALECTYHDILGDLEAQYRANLK